MGYGIDVIGHFVISAKLDDETEKVMKSLENDGNVWLYREDEFYDGKNTKYELRFPDDFHGTADLAKDLVHVVKKVLQPRGYVVNGEITWTCPEEFEQGHISVSNNVIVSEDGVVYENVCVFDKDDDNPSPLKKCRGSDPKCECLSKATNIVDVFAGEISSVHSGVDFSSGDLAKARLSCIDEIRSACHETYETKSDNEKDDDDEDDYDDNDDNDNDNDNDLPTPLRGNKPYWVSDEHNVKYDLNYLLRHQK